MGLILESGQHKSLPKLHSASLAERPRACLGKLDGQITGGKFGQFVQAGEVDAVLEEYPPPIQNVRNHSHGKARRHFPWSDFRRLTIVRLR